MKQHYEELQESFAPGDTVRLSAFGRDNDNYHAVATRTFVISAVYRSEEDEPAFDDVGEALYQVRFRGSNAVCEFLFYDQELEAIDVPKMYSDTLCNQCYRRLTYAWLERYPLQWRYSGDMYCWRHETRSQFVRDDRYARKATAYRGLVVGTEVCEVNYGTETR